MVDRCFLNEFNFSRMLKKLLTFILLLTLIATNIASIDAAYAARSKNRVKAKGKTPASAAISSTVSKKRALPKIPPFPEKAPAVDWTQVDWDKQMVLEGDKEEYHRTLDRLEVQNKRREAGKLKLKTYRMSDDEVLQYYNVPLGVREAVFQYRNGVKSAKNAKQKMNYKKQLQAALLSKGFGSTSSAVMQQQDTRENKLIDVSKAVPLKNLKLINSDKKNIQPRIKVLKQTKLQPKQQRFFDVTFEGLIRKSKTARAKKFSDALDNAMNKTLAAIKGFFINTALADDAISPFIEYYDGIEKNAVDFALYYLSQNQNSDGSFGNFNKYELTAQIVFMASEFNLADKGQFNAAINYLTSATPQNNREKALKARILLGLGQPYQQILDEIIADKNADGGFGLEQNYLSDPQTTMEVAFAFYAADYGTETHLAQALNFVLNNIKADGSMYYTKNGSASFYLIGKTAEYLKPFQEFAIGDDQNQVTVQSKIDALISFLTNNYETAPDVIDQTLIARAFQLYDKEKDTQADLREKITQSQFANGNFGTSLYATISAMHVLASAEIELVDLTNIGSLTNKQTAQFQLTIKNKGYRPINKAILYLFADNVNLNSPIDLTANNIEIAPQSSVNVAVTFDDTSRFLGSTEIKFFIESADTEISYADNWIAKNFTFASALDSSPALPMYYIAQQYSMDGIPGLNVRWKFKNDSNNSNYIILWREKNTNQWYGQNVDSAWSGAFLWGAFVEGITYEVNVGVIGKDGSITSFAYATEVKTTADDLKYTSAFNGYVTIDNNQIPNVNISALYGNFNVPTMISGENGIISNDKMRNGSNALKVSNQQYEPIVTILPTPSGQTTSDVRIFSRLISDTIPPVINDVLIQFNTTFKVKNQQEVTLLAFGSDNIALKEADFYYYNPVESSWIFLGTEETEKVANSEAKMQWYIPETMLGGGYKLKAIFSDFSGNQSAPKEWGPFEIIDGTLSTGTVTVNGLINNEWALGETKTISWNIKSAVPLKSIVGIYLNQYTVIAPSYDATKTSIDYTLPLDFSHVTDNAVIKLQIYDINDNFSVIESAPFKIVDKSPPPHAPWQPSPIVFDGITTTLELTRDLINAFHNEDNSIEVVYREFVGSLATSASQYRRIVYRKLINGQWQDPVVLKEFLYQIEQTPDVNFYDIKAIKSLNGDIHVVYQEHVGPYAEQKDLSEIYYIRVSNEQIATTKQISNDNTYSFLPDVAYSDTGIVGVVWMEGLSYATGNGAVKLYYMQGNGTATWTQKETLIDAAPDSAALTFDGETAVAFFKYQNTFRMRKRIDGAWSETMYISQTDLDTSTYIIDPEIFAVGSNQYDIFYFQNVPKISGIYDIFAIRVFVDTKSGISNVIYHKPIVNVSTKESVKNYKVLRNKDGNYNVFYAKYELSNYSSINNSITHAFHLLFIWESAYFKTHTSVLSMNVDDWLIIGTEQNNYLMTFFKNSGGNNILYNTADYSGIINYKIDPVFPLDGVSDITKQDNLKWSVTGGPIDSFDVYFGTDPYYLTQIAGGITNTFFPMPALSSQTTYYWQVVGHAGNNLIYSNPWNFSTKEIVQSLEIEINAIPNIGAAPLKVQFDAVATGGYSSNYTYAWDINNDGVVDYTVKNPTHIYTVADTYTAVLKVSDGVDTITKNITITVFNPLTVEATATPASGVVPLTVQFDASATGGYSSNYTYEWDVQSDGVIDYVTKNPVDTYTVVGVHTATLKVSDGFDNVAKTLTITVKEKPLPLTVTATADLISGTAPLTVKFDAQVKNAETENITYEWDINRDGKVDYNIKNPIHTYTQPGKYYVFLKVSESNKTAISKLNITVKTPRPLNASISALPKSGTAPLKVHFYAVAGGGQSKNYTYEWDVNNDGVIDYTVKNPSHTYTTAGDHTVSLTVLDGVESITKKIVIKVD